MKPVLVALALAACGGSSPPRPVGPSQPAIPGLIWITDAQPGRVAHAIWAAAADGEVVVVAGDHYIAQLDVATGALREYPIDADLSQLAALGGGRFVALGRAGRGDARKTVGFTFDVRTGAVATIPLSPRPDVRLVSPHVAVLDQGVVLSGQGLPLALYDPATWEIRRQLDPELGWADVAGAGHVLLATREGTTRFDLETEGQRPIETGDAFPIGVHGDLAVLRVKDGRAWRIRLVADGAEPRQLPDAVEDAEIIGDHLVTLSKTQLKIWALPGGALEHTLDFGPEEVTRVHPIGRRGLIESEGVLRLLDVDAGTLTPMPPGPWRASWVAVDGAGQVALFGRAAWRLDHGTLRSTDPMPDDGHYSMRVDDPTRLALYGHGGLEVRRLGRRGAPSRTELEGVLWDAWFATDDRVILERTIDDLGDLVMVRDGKAERVIVYDQHATVLYADPDGTALIGRHGRVAVVDVPGRLATGVELRMPGCNGVGAVAEAGGHRSALYDDDVVALWDHVTGDLRGAVRLDSDVVEVRFVPGRPDVVIATDRQVVLWSPRLPPRALVLAEPQAIGVSRDGKRLAVAFADARVAVFDFDALRAGLPEGAPLPAVEIPQTCEGADPMATPRDDDDEDGSGDGSGEAGE